MKISLCIRTNNESEGIQVMFYSYCMEGFFTWKRILYICYEVWSLFHGKVNKYKIICHSSHGSILKSVVLYSLYLNSRSSCIANLPSWDESMRNGLEKNAKYTKDNGGGRIRIPVVRNPNPRWQEKIDHWFLHILLCATQLPDLFETKKKMTYLYASVQARWIVY